MSKFFDLLDSKHEEAIQAIRHMIDVNAQEYPEYKEAATLCKFIFEAENKYSLLQEPKEFGNFYENAQDFATLCHTIYHALTDDGDIAYIRVNHSEPRIMFKCRWDLVVEDVLTTEEMSHYECLNEFKKSKGLTPLHEHSMVFYDNAYAFIKAVKDVEIESEERHKKIQELIKNHRQTKMVLS